MPVKCENMTLWNVTTPESTGRQWYFWTPGKFFFFFNFCSVEHLLVHTSSLCNWFIFLWMCQMASYCLSLQSHVLSCLIIDKIMVRQIYSRGHHFFLSLGNNTCFYGKCYYCRESEPACAEGEIMEGSLTLWLPDVWPLQKHRHPWGRTYREGKLARWVLSVNPEMIWWVSIVFFIMNVF